MKTGAQIYERVPNVYFIPILSQATGVLSSGAEIPHEVDNVITSDEKDYDYERVQTYERVPNIDIAQISPNTTSTLTSGENL